MRLLSRGVYDTLRWLRLLVKAQREDRILLFVSHTEHGYVLTKRPLSTNMLFGKQGIRIPQTRIAVDFIHFWADYFRRDYLLEKEYSLIQLGLDKDNYEEKCNNNLYLE